MSFTGPIVMFFRKWKIRKKGGFNTVNIDTLLWKEVKNK